MTPQFFSREIAVTVSGPINTPATFRLDDREYVIAEILGARPDHSFGQSTTGLRRWWQRRHRNYFLVKTTTGEVFEIYYDRGTKLSHPERKKWYLYRQL